MIAKRQAACVSPWRKRVLFLVAAFACAATVGCRNNSAPPDPAAPAASSPTPDQKVLLALDYFEPMYKVDADGRVTHLRLTGRHLPVHVMAEVGKLTELQGLDCYGTSVNDEGLAQLKDLQKLRSMGLGATPVTDKGLVHLEKLQNLQWLWLPKNTVTKAGIDKLKEARPDLNVY